MGCVSSQPRRSISLPENLVDLSSNSNNDENFNNHVHLPIATNLPRSNRQSTSHTNGHVGARSGRTFGVSTMPNRGKSVCGKLEVTDTEVQLHRNGHGPLTWPLHFLRRYGFEDGVFSFESGRRCKSGPGVFTFRCPQAEELFLLVQKNIQENAVTQFPNSVPPVIWERITNTPELEISSVKAPNRPIGQTRSENYMRPNSALFPEATNSNGLELNAQNSDALIPSLDHPDQDSNELAVVNIRPRIESKTSATRPDSLVLPSTNTEISLVDAIPTSDSSQLLVDNVFSSPSLHDDPQSPQHAYVNVEPASATNSPAQSSRGRKCFSGNSESDFKNPEPFSPSPLVRNRLCTPVFGKFGTVAEQPFRKTSHTHSFSDVTSDRHTPTSYVNFSEVPASPRAMVDYVTLSVGPSPSQSPLPSSFSFRREQTGFASPKRSISTSASPIGPFNIGGSLGRPRFRGPFTPDVSEEGISTLTLPPFGSNDSATSNYAKIDYDKTRALKETSRVNTVEGRGRRNRHDSSIL